MFRIFSIICRFSRTKFTWIFHKFFRLFFRTFYLFTWTSYFPFMWRSFFYKKILIFRSKIDKKFPNKKGFRIHSRISPFVSCKQNQFDNYQMKMRFNAIFFTQISHKNEFIFTNWFTDWKINSAIISCCFRFLFNVCYRCEQIYWHLSTKWIKCAIEKFCRQLINDVTVFSFPFICFLSRKE